MPDATEVGNSESIYWRYESLIKSAESRIRSTAGVIGAIMAVRRDLYEPIPAGVINDDTYIALQVMRKGFRVVYEPAAICRQRPVYSFRDDALRRKRITAGRFQLLFSTKWWPWNDPLGVLFLFSHKLLRLMLPIFFIGAIGANTLAMMSAEAPAILYQTLLMQVGVLGLAIIGHFAPASRRLWKVPRLAYFVLNGYLSTVRGMIDYINGKQDVMWQRAMR